MNYYDNMRASFFSFYYCCPNTNELDPSLHGVVRRQMDNQYYQYQLHNL